MVKVSKFRRKNGNWYLRYWIAGRPVDESARAKSEAAAESFRIKRELEINAGIQPLNHAPLTDLVASYLEFFPPGSAASHKHEAERILGGFLQVCGRKGRNGHHLQTHQVTPALIDRFITSRQSAKLHAGDRQDSRGRRIVRQRPVSNVTLRKELRYLSAFFNWCCRQRPPYLRENPIPLSNASRIKNDAKHHFMITEEEFRLLLQACQTPQEYLFLLLGWWTGGRRGEIRALHYYHFDFKAGMLNISHMKNNTLSVLPVSRHIVEIVERLYAEAKEADRVFPEDPLPSHGFARLCRAAGIRHHRFHDFRITTSMKIKSGGFDAGLAGLWVGNQAATNRAHYTDLTGVQTQIASLLELSGLPNVPWQKA